MSAVRKLDRLSEEDYLNDPALSEWPHEFLDGRVLAMADPTPRHEVIAGKVLSIYTDQIIDIREKMFAYLTLPTLTHYIIVAQEKQEVTVYRRTADGWEIETLTDSADELRIPGLDFSMPMSAVYQDAGLELS